MKLEKGDFVAIVYVTHAPPNFGYIVYAFEDTYNVKCLRSNNGPPGSFTEHCGDPDVARAWLTPYGPVASMTDYRARQR